MIYKFDILLKKSLKSGGLKVVTYSSLLENSEIFGKGEGLADVEGELSMVLEGPEEGFSINALFRKYRAQLVGRRNADVLGKDFPLRLAFVKADDPYSIKMATCIDIATNCSTCDDSFVLLVAKDGDCIISRGATSVTLHRGQAAFCTVATKPMTIEPDGANTIIVK